MSQIEEQVLQVFEGDDELKPIAVLRDSNGNMRPYDLSGATVEFIVKTKATDSSALFTYSTTGGQITITSATGGLLTIQFDRTNLTAPGNYRYQLRVTQNGKRRTVAFGTLKVENV